MHIMSFRFGFTGKALRTLLYATFASYLLGATAAGQVQSWPQAPIRLIVPFPAGGGTDAVGRAAAKAMGDAFGQQVIVENRPGAGGTLGAQVLAQAKPDGYTLGVATSSTHVTSTILRTDTPYHPVRDFSPISEIGSTGYVLVVTPNFPPQSVTEFVDYLKQNPDKVEYASVGPTTLGYLISELFMLEQGVDMLHIPYKGSSQVYTDLMSGVVQAFFDNPVTSAEFVKGGKLRALAVTQHTDLLPDTPTFAQVGMPDFNATFWYGIVAPAEVPDDISNKIQAAIAKFAQSEDGLRMLTRLGVVPTSSTPREFVRRIETDIATWKTVADRAGIVAE